MKKIIVFLFLICVLSWASAAAKEKTPSGPKSPSLGETQKKNQLLNRLCKDGDIGKTVGCKKIRSFFSDPRFILYSSAPGAAPSPPSKRPKGNPYLTSGFGLLTAQSLERCRETYAAYKQIFDETEKIYGEPKEFICARLRIETNFGRAMGTESVINSLYTLYVRSSRRREFAFNELKNFLILAENLGWNVFAIKGSPTGAVGLSQHEPSSYMNPRLVADGNGDGKIDLFSYEDAIPSIAQHDKTCGWSSDPRDQFNAIYCYNHSTDYVDAVRIYAWAAKIYLELKPIEQKNSPLP